MFLIIQNKLTTITNFTIYGERHSGTNLLEKLLLNNFQIPVTWDYGWKHFFGHEPVSKIYNSKNTLFIGITRNPYDWIMAMHKMPHHAPKQFYKNFTKLVTDEWRSLNFGEEILVDRNYITKSRYKNIFEMRKYKLLYLAKTMPIISQNYILLTYENLINNYIYYLDIISEKYKLNNNYKDYTIHNKNTYDIDSEKKKIIESNIDWSVEKFFGYEKLKE